MKEHLQNRTSRQVRDFGLYGETTGETDDDGLPVRLDWAADYRGRAAVVYGHTPVPRAEWVNETICIDTGCAFGRRLTALRWPQRELVSVPAKKTWAEPSKAFAAALQGTAGRTRQQESDSLLDVEDIAGPLRLHTRIAGSVAVRPENCAAALDMMARFTVAPRWLVYLPPTMAPCASATAEDLLEHPAEAFGYFRARGIRRVMCEEKHMGSRAVIVVARTTSAAETRFGIESPNGGILYTRTGRRFFDDADVEPRWTSKTGQYDQLVILADFPHRARRYMQTHRAERLRTPPTRHRAGSASPPPEGLHEVKDDADRQTTRPCGAPSRTLRPDRPRRVQRSD